MEHFARLGRGPVEEQGIFSDLKKKIFKLLKLLIFVLKLCQVYQ